MAHPKYRALPAEAADRSAVRGQELGLLPESPVPISFLAQRKRGLLSWVQLCLEKRMLTNSNCTLSREAICCLKSGSLANTTATVAIDNPERGVHAASTPDCKLTYLSMQRRRQMRTVKRRERRAPVFESVVVALITSGQKRRRKLPSSNQFTKSRHF